MAGETTRRAPDVERAEDSIVAGVAAPGLVTGVLLTVASGAIYGLAFPPTAVAPLAWIALVPLFVALDSASWRRRLAFGWLWSLLAAWSVGEWMPTAVETYYLQPRAVGYAVFAAIATTMVAPYHVAFSLVYPRLAHGRGGGRGALLPLLVAAAWTATELLRGRLFTGSPLFIGNPWALLGYSQADVLPVIQIADVAGVYGITFSIAAVNAGLAIAWLAARARAPARVSRMSSGLELRSLAVAFAPALCVLIYGVLSLSRTTSDVSGKPFVVAVIQGNVDVGSVWSREHHGENLDLYLALTKEVLLREGASPPEIVVWPESAATFFLDEEPGYRVRIARVLATTGAELLVGTPRASRPATRSKNPESHPNPGSPPDESYSSSVNSLYFNSVYVLGADAKLRGRYDKQLLVPFAEYFPFGGVEFLKRRFARVREFAVGPASAALPTRAGPVGVLICNEAMLPEVAAERVALGATWLVSPSNDTWVPNRDFAELQLDIVALRAVEQRRYLVRASTSGPSAILDPFGRVLARTDALARGSATAEIRPLEGQTIYGVVGDTFGVTCLVVAIFAVAGGRGQHRDPPQGV